MMFGISGKYALLAAVVFGGIEAMEASPMMKYGMGSWGGFGSTVKMALRNPDPSARESFYLHDSPARLGSSSAPGVTGNVMVVDEPEAIPFYMFQNQLYQVMNSSSVLYVNVVNTTDPTNTKLTTGELKLEPGDVVETNSNPQRPLRSIHTRMPTFKLTLDDKPRGMLGQWLYDEAKNALAFQTKGTKRLNARFYSCRDRGVYISLDETTHYPIMCQQMKLW
ncbi:hypothetical protein DL93DRAFT_2157380 [Clavulina sp. PMI_390]|nr:hypothetical protein DL93DRAFT_2157380 [Clavulina sp. PMI_390]